jgi:ABC-type Mn2+/Zn2+ transport system ATPase subunit
MHAHLQNLETWFLDRPKWLQDAARRVLLKGEITGSDFKEIVVLCKKETGIDVENKDLLPLPVPTGAFSAAEAIVSLQLNSISELQGINNLAPRKPLEFGPEPLTIIYGQNGAGKSGYMRVLKHACGARNQGFLHGNVFVDAPKDQKCKISYTIGNVPSDLVWSPANGVHKDLSAVSLYDTDCAQVYVTEENQVAYEPGVLSLFRVLVEICDKVDATLSQEIINKISAKPSLPPELQTTEAGVWFGKISRLTSDGDIVAHCLWEPAMEQELLSVNQRLAEANPVEKAKALRKTKGHLNDLIDQLHLIAEQLSMEACNGLLAAKKDAKAKRQVSDTDAKSVFENAPLKGIESESWKLLWEQARAYSEAGAYKEISFPNVGEMAKCVLCQQLLDTDGKKRLTSFESFVKGNLEAQAVTAEKLVHTLLDGLPLVPISQELDKKLDLGAVNDESSREIARKLCDALSRRKDTLLKASVESEIEPLPDDKVFTDFRNMAINLEAQAKVFDGDAKEDKRAELKEKANELNAKKWLSQQRPSVESERQRLEAIYQLQVAQRSANTRALSEKKSTLAEVLISAAYIERFQRELKTLGASRIRVEIVKTKTTKGQVWHQLRLKGAKKTVKTAQVLSEGEFRIVSLADFLADVEGRTGSTPFIFDDPISSLDQDFEEAAAARLVSLSKRRQVIVFTHRLSMLASLEDTAKKHNVETKILSLRSEHWGAGEPSETPIFAKKPEKVLNALLHDRLPKARKCLQEKGVAEYEPLAKSICSDIRITIERLIENNLLSDVVQRFRRGVQTLGKIEKLAKINAEDCRFIEELMTQYSKFEHAQPDEAPIPMPEPDEIEADLIKLKAWAEEFDKRPIPKV